jgi:BlaI family transcriptional regulator, penicillinase repressor
MRQKAFPPKLLFERLRFLSLTYDSRRTKMPAMSKPTIPSTTMPIPTEAELAILQILWNRGPSTVREVHNALRDRGTGYTTALKQMQVMAEKGLLTRSERFRSHLYEARIPREKTQMMLARNLLHRAFNGSAKSLVLGALTAKPISASELAEIRTILDQFEKGER